MILGHKIYNNWKGCTTVYLFWLLLSICFSSTIANAQEQELLSKQIELPRGYIGSSDTLINNISKITGITISYSNKVYANQRLSIEPSTLPLREILDRIFSRFPVDYIVRGGEMPKVIIAPKKIRYYTLSGYCKDAKNGEVLIGANVYDTLLMVGHSTNDYGFFSMTLPEGNVGAKASFVGYRTQILHINLRRDTMVTINLSPSLILQDIEIKAPRNENNYGGSSTVEIPMEQVKNMPSLLGETDVIKALEWTPGVHGGEEGFGGMSVRGGNSDQNIVMLDDVPLYSPNHLAGLYSVFNSESVNNATLIKGGFPARYGGRMSSVLDVKMKEGNMNRFGGYVNIGLLASNVTLEGPIIKEKMSFIVSARRTYFDIFSSLLQKNNDQRYAFNFYDIHAKLNYIISHNDRIYIGFFTGYDNLDYGYNYRDIEIKYNKNDKRKSLTNDSQKVKWGNIVTSARWNHVYGSTLFSNLTLSFSRYRFKNLLTNYTDDYSSLQFENGYYSGINDYMARIDFNWYTPFFNHLKNGKNDIKNNIRFGANVTYYGFYPGVSLYSTTKIDSTYSSEPLINTSSDKRIMRFESHAYIEDELKINKIAINVGMHMSSLKRLHDSPYIRLEPRIHISYMLNEKLTFKTGYSDMTQFIQTLRLASVASPADMWMPVSTNKAIPHAWQASGEIDIMLGNNFKFTAEAFHKQYVNQQTYKSSLLGESILHNNWDDIYSDGEGYTNGLEIFLHRQAGRMSGWVGYSLSRARNRFNDINDGKYFASDHDRAHSVSVFGCYKINDLVDIGATWQYTTGSPTTISDSRYSVKGTDWNYTVPIAGQRNAYRMPASHTLNIGLNIKRATNNTERKLSFGIYNVYAHSNPMFVYWKQNENAETGLKSYKLKQFSLIAWPWPYIKYSIKF